MVQKSCNSWYGKYPIIYRVLYIPGGAGFLPSTVLEFEKPKKAFRIDEREGLSKPAVSQKPWGYRTPYAVLKMNIVWLIDR